MGKQEINVKGTMSKETLVSYLKELTTGIEEGRVSLQKGDSILHLTPASHFELDVEAAVKSGKEKLNIKIKWKQQRLTNLDASPFSITGTSTGK